MLGVLALASVALGHPATKSPEGIVFDSVKRLINIKTNIEEQVCCAAMILAACVLVVTDASMFCPLSRAV